MKEGYEQWYPYYKNSERYAEVMFKEIKRYPPYQLFNFDYFIILLIVGFLAMGLIAICIAFGL